MPRKITEVGLQFREKFGYTGKIAKEAMGKELWNEWCKLAMKKRLTTPEHKKELAKIKEQRRIKHIETLKQLKETGAYLKKYCDDYKNIENYYKAAADNFIGWQCHHRLETHTSDGERRLVDITAAELIALGMYYNRPANELILMKMKDHRRLHLCGKPNARRKVDK